MLVSVFDLQTIPSNPVGPWFPALVPAPQTHMADFLDRRMAAKRTAMLKRYRDAEARHTAAWFRMSSNKEANKRGSRALVLVEGLHCSTDGLAGLTLSRMLLVARDFFLVMHMPEPVTEYQTTLQCELLEEVAAKYGAIPQPDFMTGHFSLEEVSQLMPKMHNMAPGPDGIHNGFWKGLQKRLADADPPPTGPLGGVSRPDR